jgi:hypothetical protein
MVVALPPVAIPDSNIPMPPYIPCNSWLRFIFASLYIPVYP